MEQMHSNIGEHTPDNLIGGQEVPIIVKGVKVTKGQGTLLRGTVLGIVTDTGLAIPVDSTKEDGSEVPYGILTDTVDTESETDVVTTSYISGLFNSNALIFGGADTVDTHELKLRERGIYLKENLEY